MPEPESEPKLKIIGYDSPQGSPEQNKSGEFVVDFNPSVFNISNTINYQPTQALTKPGGDPTFQRIPPVTISITFTIDGTGATKGDLSMGDQKEYVRKKIIDLRTVTGSAINGKIHRPNYLAIVWGKIYIECVITSLNITFTLFDREGTPLRATVVCGFLQRIPPGEGPREIRFESADLTKSELIKEGDILPLIAKKNYNSSSYYLQIARANRLKNFRKLSPGTKLILPPMAKK
jgi:nucleoid-associated protein YgaU